MFDVFLTVLGLMIFSTSIWIIGSIIVQLVFENKIDTYGEFVISIIIGLIVTPLTLYHIHWYLQIPFSKSFQFIGVIALTTTAIISSRIKKYHILKPKFTYLLILLIPTAILLYMRLQFPGFVGFDTWLYSRRVGYLLAEQTSRYNYDRNALNVLIGLVSSWGNVSVINAVKITSTLFFGIIGLVTSLFVNSVVKKNLYYLSVILTWSLPFLLTMSLEVIAQLFATIVLILVMTLLINTIQSPSIEVLLLIMYLWASLYNLHIIVAFSAGLPLLVGTFYILFIHRKELFKPLLFIRLIVVICGIFAIVGQPLISSEYSWFIQYFVKPYTTYLQNNLATPAVTLNESSQSSVVQTQQVSSGDTTRYSIINFPLEKENIYEVYGLLIVVSIVGLGLLIHDIRWSLEMRKEKILILLLGLIWFSYTQQNFIGIDYTVYRFIYLLLPFVVLTVIYAVTRLQTLIRPKMIQTLFLVAILILFVSKQLIFAYNQIHPTYDPEYYSFYSEVKDSIRADDSLYNLSTKPNYARSLMTYYQIFEVDRLIQCSKDRMSPQLHQPADNQNEVLFSFQVSDEYTIDLLDERHPNHDYYIVLDTNFPCIDQNKFDGRTFETVIDSDNLQLLKRNRNL